jgi:hypothetical protein
VSDDVEGAVGPDRRSFIKRLVVGAAFAVPVVSSFTMSGVEAVFGGTAGAQVINPNTTDPGGGNRGDDDDDEEKKDEEKKDGGTPPAQAPSAAASAVVASPKFTG